MHKGPITSVVLIDDATCASSSQDGSIIIWKLQKHQILEKLRHITVGEQLELGIISMLYISLTNNLVSIDGEKKVSYINLDTMRIEKQLQAAYDGNLTAICLNDTKHEIAVGDEAGEIKVFNNTDGKLVFLDTLAHSAPITSLRYSPDGQKLISADCHGKMLIWTVM